METTQTLQMRFITQTGSRVTLSLDNPKDTLSDSEVIPMMDLIIAKNIFTSKGGDLVAKDTAQIIERTAKVIYET